MTKFRLVLSGLVAVSLFATFYLIFVHGATISFSYLGPNAEYFNRWTDGLLSVSIVFALAGLMTLYFTFFEFHEDESGRLKFNNPDSFILKFVLKDKLTKPISSCSLFWEVVGYALYSFVAISMSIYSASVVGYIKREGLELHSFVVLCAAIWLYLAILSEFLGKRFVNRLSSNPWLIRMGFVFFAMFLVVAIISNPMTFIYILVALLVVATIIFISIWLSGKSSKGSLYGSLSRSHLLSKKEGYCPVIYPKDAANNDAEQAVR